MAFILPLPHLPQNLPLFGSTTSELCSGVLRDLLAHVIYVIGKLYIIWQTWLCAFLLSSFGSGGSSRFGLY